MKKIYFAFLSVSLGLTSVFAQTPTFELVLPTATSIPIANNTIFDDVTTPSASISRYFKLRNITATTQTYTIRRTDNLLNTVGVGDVAEAYFCTGTTCYVPSVSAALFVINAGTDDDLITYLGEASAIGLSNVSYEVSNGTETLEFIMRYNYATGINSNLNELANVSNIYPNPSASKSFLNINSAKEINGTKLLVYNCLGDCISSKEIHLQKGKNTISIDSESLETGIYFVKITNGSSTITRKLTINK